MTQQNIRKIAKVVKKANTPRQYNMKQGVVQTFTATDVQTNRKIPVSVDGAVIYLKYLASYFPVVGETVWVGPTPNGWLILGPLAGNGGMNAACILYQAIAQSVPTTTNTNLTFDAVIHDPYGMYNAGGASIKLPLPGGIYQINATVQLPGVSVASVTRRLFYVTANGTAIGESALMSPASNAAGHWLSTSALFKSVGGELVTAGMWQDTGAAMTPVLGTQTPQLSVARIGNAA